MISHGDVDSITMPRNYLRPCLLLSLAAGTAHGYELLDRVAELGLTRPDPGRLYRCLRAMDEEGLIESHWEPSTLGPARRTYTLTAAGRAALDASADSLTEVARLMEVFACRYRLATGREPR
jgi:poly-beta-hydroxybutyrate-responsive repressor